MTFPSPLLSSVLLHVLGWPLSPPSLLCACPSYLLPLCVIVSLASHRHWWVMPCVVISCAPWSFFLLSQCRSLCFAHSGRSSYSHLSKNAVAHAISNPPVNLPTCKFSQSLSVLVTLLWSSPGWTLLESSQNRFFYLRLLNLLLEKRPKSSKIPSVP